MNRHRFLIIVTAIVSLALEVIGTQIAFLFFDQSSQAVSISLSAYFLGLSVANYFCYRYKEFAYKKIENLIFYSMTLTLILVLFLLYNYDDVTAHILKSARFLGSLKFELLLFVFLFLPALTLGFVFPIVVEKEKIEQHFSLLHFFDIMGAIFGSLLFGYYFIPRYGLKSSYFLIAIIISFTIIIIYKFKRMKELVFLFCIWGIFISFNYDDIGLNIKKSGHKFFGQILFQEHSPFGMVTIAEQSSETFLYINYRSMCSSRHKKSEEVLARLPIQFHRSQKDLNVLNIGFGCGFTAETVLSSSKVKNLDIAEINPVVIKASRIFFKPYHQNIIKNQPQFFEIGGLEYIRETSSLYDIIILDVEEPVILHSSKLFTLEGLREFKSKLKDQNGIYSLWTFYQPETVKILYNTLKLVFKDVQIVPVDNKIIMMGSDSDMNIQLPSEDRQFVDNILKMDLDIISTMDNIPFKKYYKLENIFGPQVLESNESLIE